MQRVVLVDEDPERCRDETEVLCAAHYQVTTCLEPGAAFVCVCEAQPDLVILYTLGHHRTGCQLLNQLKQQEETEAIPILVAWPPGALLETERHTFEERGVHLFPQPMPCSQLPMYVAEVLIGSGPAHHHN